MLFVYFLPENRSLDFLCLLCSLRFLNVFRDIREQKTSIKQKKIEVGAKYTKNIHNCFVLELALIMG